MNMKIQASMIVFLITAVSYGDLLISESFNGSSAPTGWIINGKENTSHTSPETGTLKTDSDFFPAAGANGYLRLTENSGNQRATALYTAQTFRTDRDFTFRAEVNIASGAGSVGADGISFFWLNAASLSGDLSTYQGGMGEWQGAPRGNVTGTTGSNNNLSDYGSYAGLEGYSFEFDHYQNTSLEQLEYNHLVRLEDWVHLPGAAIDQTSDDNFYEDNGWQLFEYSYDASENEFTMQWNYDDLSETFESSASYVIDGLDTYEEAYFGLGAGTGGQTASHDVRNLTFTGVVPEPACLTMIGVAGSMLLWLRRRFMS
jgi:hypothetical protein